jgi:hypothetical protein
MHLHPIALFVMLTHPEQPQHLRRLDVRGREQRMPAISLWPWHQFPADDGSHGLRSALPL